MLQFRMVANFIKEVVPIIELNGANLTNFLLKKYGNTWDDVAVEGFGLDEIDLNAIEKFKDLAKDRIPRIDQEKDVMQLMSKLNLHDGKFFKRAAVLLFAKNPQKYFIQSHSKIGRFLTESDIQTSDIIEGNLIDQVDKILDVLRSKYLKSYISYEGVYRREKLQYPYSALREAVINALVHRDYMININLQIRVYDNKLVIFNGATLPENMNVSTLAKPHPSMPHNPVIANVFYKAGLIESWGKGTLDIIQACHDHKLPNPDFEYDGLSIKVTFYSNVASGGASGGADKLHEFIRQNPGLNSKQMSEILNVALCTLERHLKTLKEAHKVEFRGASKTGGYYVK